MYVLLLSSLLLLFPSSLLVLFFFSLLLSSFFSFFLFISLSQILRSIFPFSSHSFVHLLLFKKKNKIKNRRISSFFFSSFLYLWKKKSSCWAPSFFICFYFLLNPVGQKRRGWSVSKYWGAQARAKTTAQSPRSSATPAGPRKNRSCNRQSIPGDASKFHGRP